MILNTFQPYYEKVAASDQPSIHLPEGKYRAVPHRIAPGKATGRVSLAFKLRAPLAAELVLQNGDVTTARLGAWGLSGSWEKKP
jgi:hypothetical protein